MNVYKIYYNRTEDLLYILFFGTIIISVILLLLINQEIGYKHAEIMLSGIIISAVLGYMALKRYRKNEYIESIEVGRNKMIIFFSNNSKKKYSFDEISKIWIGTLL